MTFDPAVKTAMFIRCNRLCCLCLKQCGLNIEAAHIIDEAAGGPNDEDNGIPLCFDCHQEIGSYKDKHPRGTNSAPTNYAREGIECTGRSQTGDSTYFDRATWRGYTRGD